MEPSMWSTLPEITRLSPLVWRVMGGNPGKFTLQGTNTYLIGRGTSRILIDTGDGIPTWLSLLRKHLHESPPSDFGLTPGQPRPEVTKVILTHRHHDHVNGVADLLTLFPRAQIFKYRSESHPTLGEDQGWKVTRYLQDGEVFQVEEGVKLKVVYTPGHTDDHVCLHLTSSDGEENGLFTGDNVLGHGTSVFENLRLYMDSLAKMKAVGARKGYPGHGEVLENVGSTISDYIKHREIREQQIVRALKGAHVQFQGRNGNGSGGTTVAELTDTVYGELPMEIKSAAMRGIGLVVQKLVEEGRVAEAEGKGGEMGWKLVGGLGSGEERL
ncbi:metallo-beta-lactamase superfamily protein [Ascobolus immersus RN42]|uniref:Metallo-beta-lactamase superfamily protein n=1 Tax=Ascobolus immersus RN42 TaxID=1160509 RepID=A0A3N4IS93_ASCIM|nr:metallo-beta-lactamase superfamily protein [Ascobolus immersus RN42]